MKKILSGIIILSILILDFLALDDITTGNEPDLYLEYAILASSVILITAIIYLNLRKFKYKSKK